MTNAGGMGEAHRPAVLVVGYGHAGGSIAAASTALGLPTEIWGRSDPAALPPALLHHVLRDNSSVRYRRVDVHGEEPGELAQRLAEFDWVFAANEPRPQRAGWAERSALVEQVDRFYETLQTAGFDSPDKRVVRVGSAAAERPLVAAPDALPYFEIKQALLSAAQARAEDGLFISTIAPTEIHSPFSTLEPDPYATILGNLGRLPLLHDLEIAAVSDHTLGLASLAVAAAPRGTGWYEISDASIGTAEVVRYMASPTREQGFPNIARWEPPAAWHLFDVLETGATVDLDLLGRHTAGLERELTAIQAAESSQQAVTAALLWWAPPAARLEADRARRSLSSKFAGSLLQTLGQQMPSRLLALLLALGADRGASDVATLAPELRDHWPTLSRFATQLEDGEQRRTWLLEAIYRQAGSLNQRQS